MRHALLTLLALVVFGNASCAPRPPLNGQSATPIRLKLTSDKLPGNWQWILQDTTGLTSNGKSLTTLGILTSVFAGAKQVYFTLQCPDAAAELSQLDALLSQSSKSPPPIIPKLKYFEVTTASFRSLELGEELQSFDSRLGVTPPARTLKFDISADGKSVSVALSTVYTLKQIASTPELADCLRRSTQAVAQSLGPTLTYIPAVLIGGALVLSFTARALDATTTITAANIANVDLAVNLNQVQLSFGEWGKLNSDFTLDKMMMLLQSDHPDPVAAVGAFEGAAVVHAIVASRQAQL